MNHPTSAINNAIMSATAEGALHVLENVLDRLVHHDTWIMSSFTTEETKTIKDALASVQDAHDRLKNKRRVFIDSPLAMP